MKHIINLDNGTKLEITGTEVKHIDVDGSILYDTVRVKDVPGLPYFFFMGKMERTKVKEWFNSVNSIVDKKEISKRNFITRVESALKVIDYDYCIATLEPSLDEHGKIFYEEGNEIAVIGLGNLEKVAADFYSDEKWHSELARLEEGDLFKAYRIAMGYWSLEYVCDDSSSAGNYWNSPNTSHGIELSGAREVGGFKDGIGNTQEIYQTETKFAIVGGHSTYNGSVWPVATVDFIFKSGCSSKGCSKMSPVLALKRH